MEVQLYMSRSSGEIPNGETSKKSPKSQLSGLHRELGAILKEIKVITDKIRESEESGSIEVSHYPTHVEHDYWLHHIRQRDFLTYSGKITDQMNNTDI